MQRMISFISKIIKRRSTACHDDKTAAVSSRISGNLDENTSLLAGKFEGSVDFIVRPFIYGGKTRSAACFIDGLINSESINQSILRPLMSGIDGAERHSTMQDVLSNALTACEADVTHDAVSACEACLDGDCVVFIDGIKGALIINAKGWEKRSISEPQTDTVIRGPREGFTESMRTNTALLRRRLKVPDLIIESMTYGQRTRTHISLVYIKSIADPALIEEIKARLDKIDSDAILNSGYIEEFIEDNPLSVFQTISYTEKPDVVAGKLLEGRAAIIIDGTPFVLTMPMLFIENFQTPEDYAVRPHFALFLRIIRFLSFFISLVTPAFFIALTNFHHELLPTAMLFTIAASSEGLPFPSAIETAIMLAAFELIREAGVRLPKPIGQAISIVGALVMGQAATQAGIVGAPVVIVIALTGVTGFVSPQASDAVSILRWALLIPAALMGGFGLTMALLALLIYLGSIKSFGVDYLSPIAPLYPGDLKDVFIRAPLWAMKNRPESLNPQDLQRQRTKKPHFNPGGGK